MKFFMAIVAFIMWSLLLHYSWPVALDALAFGLLFWLLSLRCRPVAMAAGDLSRRLNALLRIPGQTLGRWG